MLPRIKMNFLHTLNSISLRLLFSCPCILFYPMIFCANILLHLRWNAFLFRHVWFHLIIFDCVFVAMTATMMFKGFKCVQSRYCTKGSLLYVFIDLRSSDWWEQVRKGKREREMKCIFAQHFPLWLLKNWHIFIYLFICVCVCAYICSNNLYAIIWCCKEMFVFF